MKAYNPNSKQKESKQIAFAILNVRRNKVLLKFPSTGMSQINTLDENKHKA